MQNIAASRFVCFFESRTHSESAIGRQRQAQASGCKSRVSIRTKKYVCDIMETFENHNHIAFKKHSPRSQTALSPMAELFVYSIQRGNTITAEEICASWMEALVVVATWKRSSARPQRLQPPLLRWRSRRHRHRRHNHHRLRFLPRRQTGPRR